MKAPEQLTAPRAVGATLLLTASLLLACTPPPVRRSPQDGALPGPTAPAGDAGAEAAPERGEAAARAALRRVLELTYRYNYADARIEPGALTEAQRQQLTEDLEQLQRALAEQQAALEAALFEAPTGRPLSALIEALRGRLSEGGERALFPIERPDGLASWMLVRLLRRPAERVRAGDAEVAVLWFDAVEVLGYEDFLRAELPERKGPTALSFAAGQVVYVDARSLAVIAERDFLGRLEAYRALAAAAAEPEAYAARAGDRAKLLAFAKDALRWKSLRPIIEEELEASGRVRRFIEVMGRQEGVRVAAMRAALTAFEAREGRAPATPKGQAPGLSEEWVAVHKEAWLRAIAAGEARGLLATALGLAAQQAQRRAPLSGQHLGALAAVVALLGEEDEVAGLRRLVAKPPAALAEAAEAARAR